MVLTLLEFIKIYSVMRGQQLEEARRREELL